MRTEAKNKCALSKYFKLKCEKMANPNIEVMLSTLGRKKRQQLEDDIQKEFSAASCQFGV